MILIDSQKKLLEHFGKPMDENSPEYQAYIQNVEDWMLGRYNSQLKLIRLIPTNNGYRCVDQITGKEVVRDETDDR